jgi:starch-binding outer membrane protein, SusD/RagB family
MKSIWLVLLFSFSIASCRKFIETPSNVPGNLVTAQVFADSATALAAVTGIYNSFAIGAGTLGFGNGAITVYTGLSSDELAPGGLNISDNDYQQLYLCKLTSTNIYTTGLWQNAYASAGLYQINACIEALSNYRALSPTAGNNRSLSPALSAQLLGEACFLRAFFYFNLANLFGPVPLVITTNYQTNSTLSRSDTGAIYRQIVSDLSNAQLLLTAPYPTPGRLRPNLYAALALQARVDLYRQQWTAAEAAATAIINAGPYQLETALDHVFLEGSKESIWQLPGSGETNDPNTTTEGVAFIPQVPSLLPEFIASNTLLSAFTPGDQRRQRWFGTVSIGSLPFYYPAKYLANGINNYTVPVQDYMFLRLAEQYLIRAEARAKQNQLTAALADLNIIRNRAGLTDTTTTTLTATLGAILHERQVELFCEWGHRWYDLKRTENLDSVLSAIKPGWSPIQALYPIPPGEIKADPALTQNSGY